MTPWHPAVVHLPLGVAVVLPLLAIAMALGVFTLSWSRRTFVAVALLLLVQFGGSWVAHETGEQEAERVAEVVPREAIEHHEQWGNLLWLGSGVLLLLASAATLVNREGVGRALVAATVAGSFVTAFFAYEAGEHGGELVWKHGAATTGAGPR